ncbi:MAG: ABC transporter ATP-binding protein [Infirmifilum sp.]|uniref:Spermidine/putrescine ABC transporter ATP-binding protein n=1 Tax=Infirmifilum uzonense TaxID=1550241 RepID=A0A0F7FIT5_9CREN|nr:ABC transporter ATP-binding protein [Infirmifilum uzonense]AKG39312.1 spermidine/putrescine ABC transporter ATP-binding protein [Infirmifilum uzonense]
MVSVRVEDVWMLFGNVKALQGVDLEVREGEMVTLLGPSGCGKTTLLRVISGLYKPTKGKVYFDSEDVTDKNPWERNVGLVFQDYALWPHLTVYDNIAYGLRLRKVEQREIKERVRGVARLLGIEELLDRYPHQLSGGQQQRVALARAIVINPSVMLLDEPLSNLDAKIRINVRTEIRKLQKKLNITSIYVTHDQEEALVLSDRIVVMNHGRVEQIGTPFEIYYHPKTLFVADFVGQVNIIKGRINGMDESRHLIEVDSEIGRVLVSSDQDVKSSNEVYLIFRPEMVEVSKVKPREDNESTIVEGMIDAVQFLGNILRADVAVGEKRIRVELHNPLFREKFSPQDRVFVRIPASNIRILTG